MNGVLPALPGAGPASAALDALETLAGKAGDPALQFEIGRASCRERVYGLV